jgi:excisionase family DNA binding protein
MSPALNHALALVCTLAQDEFPGLNPDQLRTLISRATRPVVTAQPSVDLMTVQEVATALKVTTRSIYGLLAANQLPRVKIGRSTRIPRQALERFIQSQGGDLTASVLPQAQSKLAQDEVPHHKS